MGPLVEMNVIILTHVGRATLIVAGQRIWDWIRIKYADILHMMDCTLTVSPNKPFSLKLLLSGYFARIREKELRHSGIKLQKLNCTHVVRSHSLLPRHTTQKWPEENSVKEIIPLKTH